MPIMNVDRVQKRVAALKKKLAEKGDSLDAGIRRSMKKRLRRAQRKGRRLATEAARLAPKPKAAADSAEAPAAEASSE